MSSLPSLNTLDKVFRHNPTTTVANSSLVERKNFTMGHLQRMEADKATNILNTLDWNNLTKTTNGLVSSDSFHLTPGVLKFKGGGNITPPPTEEPPVYTPGEPTPPPPQYIAPPPAEEIPEPIWGIDGLY